MAMAPKKKSDFFNGGKGIDYRQLYAEMESGSPQHPMPSLEQMPQSPYSSDGVGRYNPPNTGYTTPTSPHPLIDPYHSPNRDYPMPASPHHVDAYSPPNRGYTSPSSSHPHLDAYNPPHRGYTTPSNPHVAVHSPPNTGYGIPISPHPPLDAYNPPNRGYSTPSSPHMDGHNTGYTLPISPHVNPQYPLQDSTYTAPPSGTQSPPANSGNSSADDSSQRQSPHSPGDSRVGVAPENTVGNSNRKKRQQRCRLCANHGVFVEVKGHKWYCKYRESHSCDKCEITRKRQYYMAEQQKLTREQQQNQQQTQAHTNPDTSTNNASDNSQGQDSASQSRTIYPIREFPRMDELVRETKDIINEELFEMINKIVRPRSKHMSMASKASC